MNIVDQRAIVPKQEMGSEWLTTLDKFEKCSKIILVRQWIRRKREGGSQPPDSVRELVRVHQCRETKLSYCEVFANHHSLAGHE